MKTGLVGDYAGFVSRAIAFFIDLVVITMCIAAAGWFLSVTSSVLQLQYIINLSPQASAISQTLVIFFTNPTVITITSYTFFLFYHAIFLTAYGQTPGKSLIGLRVVKINKHRITLFWALLRTLAYVISALPLFLGFLWILVDNKRMAFHDKIARTYEVYTWQARPDERFLSFSMRKLRVVQRAQKMRDVHDNQRPPAG